MDPVEKMCLLVGSHRCTASVQHQLSMHLRDCILVLRARLRTGSASACMPGWPALEQRQQQPQALHTAIINVEHQVPDAQTCRGGGV